MHFVNKRINVDTVNDKLHMRKVPWFIGFYHNVGKTFVVLLLTGTKTKFYIYIGTQNGIYKISKENFNCL